MRRRSIAVLLLLCGLDIGRAAAQASRPAAVPGANPRDVRETFLAIPLPAASPARPLLARVAPVLATRARRERALDSALANAHASVDPRNGYLELCVAAPNEAGCLGEVIVTYFNRANGERLVVMQVADVNSLRTEDYFWRLAGGRFTPIEGRTILPDFAWADFWGDQPLPRGYDPRFFRQMGALRFTWPQQGTTVFAVLDPLGDDVPGPRGEQLNEIYEQRRYHSIELGWDRQRGVFTKGRRNPYEPEEHDHDHEH